MKKFLIGITLALLASPIAASAQHGGGHAAGGHAAGGHAVGGSPTGGHATFGNWHAAPPVTRGVPPARVPQAPMPRTVPNHTINGTPYYRGTTHYSNPGPLNDYYARHPNMYPGGSWSYSRGSRWYNGYWHHYWGGAHWTWFGGFYGFWFPLNAITVFVYEAAPGVCQYWDGYEWVPYYDPDTGYYCPY